MGGAQAEEADSPSEDDELDLSRYVTVEEDPDGRIVEEPSKALVEKVLESSNQGPLITINIAEKKIGTEILEVLDAKFKGKLTEARHPDALDRLF